MEWRGVNFQASRGGHFSNDVDKLAHLEHKQLLPDLEVTPNAVYVRTYTRVGSRNGALRITDPHLLAATTAFLQWAHQQHTTSLADFARWRHQARRAA